MDRLYTNEEIGILIAQEEGRKKPYTAQAVSLWVLEAQRKVIEGLLDAGLVGARFRPGR